jgi:hypothetical protein
VKVGGLMEERAAGPESGVRVLRVCAGARGLSRWRPRAVGSSV